jgi:hypothetical protein
LGHFSGNARASSGVKKAGDRERQATVRLTFVLIVTFVTFLAVACNDDDQGSSGSRAIPSPAASVLRQDCETVAATGYFLNEEERTWFTENCNRLDCTVIRGTPYVSVVEREWFLDNCV